VGTLDLHANVTRHMVDQATALVGYHTAPHVDQYETGQRGMELLYATLMGHANPMTALRRLPMLLPGETARTTDGPYAEVMEQAKGLARCMEILDNSVFSVQPWLDVYDVGCSVLVISDGDGRLAEAEADRLADTFWERRHEFGVELTPTADAVDYALSSADRPIILADSADAPSSGAPGDSTVVLKALLDARPSRDCFLNIVDPQAVATLIKAGVGQQVTLQIGAKFAPAFYAPVEVTGQVKLISDGEFVQKGPGFHGEVLHRGRTAVLKNGRIHLVVMERAVRQWDPELYRSVGLEPRDAQIVVVKSPAAFRAAYEPFAAEIIIIDAPGVCSPDLRSFPFRRARRPLYPLDEFDDWRS
jgi:microcystin degradation protein MlrC